MVPLDTELSELAHFLTGDPDTPSLSFSLGSPAGVTLAPAVTLRAITADMRTPQAILDLLYRVEAAKPETTPKVEQVPKVRCTVH